MTTDALERFAYRFIKRWLKTLYLRDWSVTVEWCSQTDVDEGAGYSALAYTRFNPAAQTAQMRLSNERHWQVTDEDAHEYLPDTLVHELVHLKLLVAEDRLDSLKPLFKPFIPEVSHPGFFGRIIDIREAYVETVTQLVVDMEARCKSKK